MTGVSQHVINKSCPTGLLASEFVPLQFTTSQLIKVIVVKYSSGNATLGLNPSAAPHHLPNKLSVQVSASFLQPHFPLRFLAFSKTVVLCSCCTPVCTLSPQPELLIFPHGSSHVVQEAFPAAQPPSVLCSAYRDALKSFLFLSAVPTRLSSLRKGVEAYLYLYTPSLASIWKIFIEDLLCGRHYSMGWGYGGEQGRQGTCISWCSLILRDTEGTSVEWAGFYRCR